MFERAPKKRENKEETDLDEDLGIEEVREQMEEQFDQMTLDEKVEHARIALERAPDKIRIKNERIAHLAAQIERLQEQLRSVDGPQKQFIRDQLDETKAKRDEYLDDLELTEDRLKTLRDFLDQNRNLN